VICLYGSDDAALSICTQSPAKTVKVHEFKGDHHLGEDYAGAAKLIIEAL